MDVLVAPAAPLDAAPAAALDVVAKLGPRAVELAVAGTVADLLGALRAAFGLHADASLRVLCRGKLLGDPAAPLARVLAPGARLMVMQTSGGERRQVEHARPERMRGFDDDDERLRTGGLAAAAGAAGHRPAASSSAPAAHRFHATAALRALPPGASPPVAAAAALLDRLASDPAVLGLLRRHGWSVGLLSEMPPEGQVGVSAACLMGLNKNRGEEVLLRLRTDDWQGLRPYASVVEVLLHELAHNVHSDHDDAFKALNSQLRREYRAAAHDGRSTGGGELAPARAPARAPAADGGRVLGGASGADAAAGAAAGAAAAARRRAAEAGPAAAPAWARPAGPCACGLCAADDGAQCDACSVQP